MYTRLLASLVFFCWASSAWGVELAPRTVTPVVLSETKTVVFRVSDLNPDCTVSDTPVIRVTREPRSGTVEIEEGLGFSNYPKESQRYECNTKQTAMTNIFYTSAKGFKGADNFDIEVFYPQYGASQKVRLRVSVR